MINERDKILQLLNSADKIIRQYLISAESANRVYQSMLNSLQGETIKMKSETEKMDEVVQEYPKLLYEAHYVLHQLTQRLESKAKVPLLEDGWSPTLVALNRITNRIRKKMDLPLQYYTLQRTSRRQKTCPMIIHESRKQHRRQNNVPCERLPQQKE